MTYMNYNISFVTSRYLATGDAITTIAYNFQAGVATARQIVLDVCMAMWDVLAPIYMPVALEDNGSPLLMSSTRDETFPIVLELLMANTL